MRDNMSLLQETTEKRRAYPDYRDEIVNKIRRVTGGTLSPKSQVETEKRIRREIANSNERRRMQSINTGFETLRSLLPPPQEGEKLSKATILQMAAKYIQNLHAEVTTLKTQVTHYRQVLPGNTPYTLMENNEVPNPPRKRKADDSRIVYNEIFKSRTNSQEDMDNERLSRHPSVDDDLTGHDAPQYDLLHLTCLRKPDYEQYAVEPNLPTGNTQVIVQSHVHSLVSASSRPESTSSGVVQARSNNCLDNLVMAIEQIEGTQVLTPKENEEALLVQEASRYLESTKLASPTSDLPYHPATQNHVIKPTISPYTEQIMKAASLSSPSTAIESSVTVTTAAGTGVVAASGEKSSASEEYPIVTRLLNRPIPHKYLHRPQVVVNSSH